MMNNLTSRDARISLEPSVAPASEATHTRSNAHPRARTAVTHVLTGSGARPPPPQVQMEEMPTIPSAPRPRSASFHRARRSVAAARSTSGQETRGQLCSCDLSVLYGSRLPMAAADAALVALLVDADDQQRPQAAHGGHSQYRGRDWDGWS